MARVITFSKYFPSYHYKHGFKTRFVEKLIESFLELGTYEITNKQLALCEEIRRKHVWSKNHTVRKGKRWKVGDKFSPRIWSGTPYRSKQITIAPDIEVKKVWDIVIIWGAEYEDDFELILDDITLGIVDQTEIAKNDGLNLTDFMDWFKTKDKGVFEGQIICWNEKVDYLKS